MFNTQSKKQNSTSYKNTFEAVKGNIGAGIFDQFMGHYESNLPENGQNLQPDKTSQKPALKGDRGIFNYAEYHEKTLVRNQIKELMEQIKREVEMIKKADKTLLADVKDIEKLTLGGLPEKPGIYHIRFLEIVLNILRLIRAKIGESRTWLQAMITKKKKRGSLFASLSKKKGTQYSLSQELQVTRQTG